MSESFRFHLHWPVWVESHQGISRCLVRHMTDSSMFLESSEWFPIGSHILVTFECPQGGTTMVTRGEVKHSMCFSYTSAKGQVRSMRGVRLRLHSFQIGETTESMRGLPV